MIAGPTLSHRSLGGGGEVTACHCSSTHTSGIVASADHVITPDNPVEHGVPACGAGASANATGAVPSAMAAVAITVLSMRGYTFVRSVRINITLYCDHSDRFQYRSVPVPIVDGDHGCIIGA